MFSSGDIVTLTVIFYDIEKEKYIKITNNGADGSDMLLNELMELLGKENVVLQ